MKSNTIMLVVATLVVLAGGYWYFFTGEEEEPPLTAVSTTNAAQIQFQQLVSQLRPISFNTGIFSDPRFLKLVDLTTPIVNESIGRLDPFSPVTGASRNE